MVNEKKLSGIYCTFILENKEKLSAEEYMIKLAFSCDRFFF